MTKLLNKSSSPKFFGDLVLPRMKSVDIPEALEEGLRKSQVVQFWVDQDLVEFTEEDVDEMDRDEFIMTLMDSPDAQRTTDDDPRPTVTWLNNNLPGGMKPVTADERDSLWKAREA